MRHALLALVVCCLAVAPAHASENRILVSEVHHFVTLLNDALNSNDRRVSRGHLENITSDNVNISMQTSRYGSQYQLQNVWYNHPQYGAHYRYPVNPYYMQSGVVPMKKWDFISRNDYKKRMIPGYRAQAELTNHAINPYGSTAVLDVDLKEYGSIYSPYYAGLVQHVKHSHSKCKIYLSKVSDKDLMMTRMDCNTNTSLPF
jgi:hypothetical protein